MYDLSVLIPARNEEFLRQTIDSVLQSKRGNTQVIASLDGSWPVEPIPDHPDVQMIYRSRSIGQRAATNECAKLSRAKYIMKLDAHCALAEGFDVTLMAECDYDWTVIPRQYNLHVFDWVCKLCGYRSYQGPKPEACQSCHRKGTIDREIIWKPRDGQEGRPNRCTEAWRFDHDLHFKYHGAWKQPGEITDTMSLLGACWFLHRKRYWQLEGMDERHTSWGQMGTELACKTWLSGGRLVCNKRTWFAHLFRTQPGFGFPYPISGNDQERARERSRHLWLYNNWRRQVYPLSWLIEKFAPLPDWHDPIGRERLALVNAEGARFRSALPAPFSASHPLTDETDSFANPISALDGSSVRMAATAKLKPTPSHISSVSNEGNVSGVTTTSVITNEVVEFGLTGASGREGRNEPRIGESVDSELPIIEKEPSVSGLSQLSAPNPAFCHGVDLDSAKEASNNLAVNVGNSEILGVSHDSASSAGLGSEPGLRYIRSSGSSILTKGIVYYTENRCPEPIFSTAQKQLARSINGHQLVSVSLQPIEFGDNITLGLQRGILTMFQQILAGLSHSTADIVFLCEHDVLYHPSHFDFIPPRNDVYYYNEHTYKVDAETGQAVFYYTKQTSGLCAYRTLLVDHYRRRIAKCEQNARDLIARGEKVRNDGFSRHMGFEPGCHREPRGVDNFKAERWMSEYPNIDIRHNMNLTASRWSQEEFRNPDACLGWKMVDGVPGWGRTKGRFYEFLSEVSRG